MKCHKLMYKPYRKTAPYQDFIQKQKQKQQKHKKSLFYEEIIKFRESRYPLQFLKQLEEKINPFQLSLEKLKELFSHRHPEYSNQLVNESVEHIFNRKCQQSEMVKESAMIIEDGDEYIRNGRKLIKQDFSFDFSNFFANGEESKLQNSESSRANKSGNSQSYKKSFNKSLQKMKSQQNNKRSQQVSPSTDRNAPPTSDRMLMNRSRTDSPSKIVQIMRRTQRFNQLLLQQIRKDRQRFENLELVEQGNHNDSINYNYQQQLNAYTDRSKQNESMNSFRESDLLVRPDALDTGRSQVEELNFLLSTLNFEQAGQETRRSGKSQKTLRINREIKQQLYTARGTLKFDIVKRAIEVLKKENRSLAGGDTSRIKH